MEWTGWQIDCTAAGSGLDDAGAGRGQAEVVVVIADPASVEGETGMLHPLLDDALRDLFRRGVFTAKNGETAVLPGMGLMDEKYAIYVGCDRAAWTRKKARIVSGGIGRSLAGLKASRLNWHIPNWFTQGIGVAAAAGACAEGLLLGLYKRNTAGAEPRQVPQVNLRFQFENQVEFGEWERGFQRGVEFADAVCYARDLTNLPGNFLTPAAFASEAADLAVRFGLECRIYDEKEAAAAAMGGLLAVGMGSVNPPRMIVLKYRGRPESEQWTGLIGKGVTFDTGGINLKTGGGLEEFISDMGGAAAVFGVMRGLAARKPRINVVAVVPAAENMPSGSAYKPGDVITTYSGLTVEVLNTDAEGRIVLADGLTTAIGEGAGRLVDVATLTGAVMHALGDVTTGAISNDEPLLQTILQASEQADEYIWPLPSHPEYKRMLRSSVADLKNHGGAWGGAIAGGLFIGSFAGGLPWVHLDIGGTAWMWEDRDLEPKGGTGVMVRTLLEWLETESGKES